MSFNPTSSQILHAVSIAFSIAIFLSALYHQEMLVEALAGVGAILSTYGIVIAQPPAIAPVPSATPPT